MFDSTSADKTGFTVPKTDEAVEKVAEMGGSSLERMLRGVLGSFCFLLWFSSFTDFLLSLLSSRAA